MSTWISQKIFKMALSQYTSTNQSHIGGTGSTSGSYTIDSSDLWSSTAGNLYIGNNNVSLAGISGVGDFMIGEQTIEEKVECEVKKALDSLNKIESISLTKPNKKIKKPYLNRLIDEHKKRCGGVLERLREEF
jgi:hypothetical protein